MKKKLIAVTLTLAISLSSIMASTYPVKAIVGNKPINTYVTSNTPLLFQLALL